MIYIVSILDSALPFVYNYKPANFKEDFISALTALVTAQDDPQRLKELTQGAKNILNNNQEQLPRVLRQVKLILKRNLLRDPIHWKRYLVGNANM